MPYESVNSENSGNSASTAAVPLVKGVPLLMDSDSENETLETISTDYTEILEDIATMNAWINLQMLVIAVFIVLSFGLNLGQFLMMHFRGK